jgi:exodeoxyribonuclease VII large subunit
LLDKPSNSGIPLHTFLTEVGAVLKRGMPGGQWVHAEILKVSKDRHCSLELSSDSKLQAKARAVIWQGSMSIVDRFEKVTGTPLSPGLKILFKCSVRFHAQYGLSLEITDIDPAYTLGDMEAKLQAIRSRLTALNEIDLNRRLPPPEDFCRVAVIAPDKAAGLGDFKSNADKLSDYGLCHFDYFATKFQGEAIAEPFLKTMVQVIESHTTNNPYDVLVIIRGGGDKAGLYELNEIKIARGVCRCPIPIFVGVGHERDKTILDEVANRSFETPSFVIGHIEKTIVKNARDASKTYLTLQKIAAALVSDAKQDISSLINTNNHHAFKQLAEAKQKINTHHKALDIAPDHIIRQSRYHAQQTFTKLQLTATKRAVLSKEALIALHKAIESAAVKGLSISQQRIEGYYLAIQREPYAALRSAKINITGMRSEMAHNGMRHVAGSKAGVEKAFTSLQTEAKVLTANAKHTVSFFMERVTLQDPKKILARGFALLTSTEGRPLTKASQLSTKQSITIQLSDGQSQAIIEETHHD